MMVLSAGRVQVSPKDRSTGVGFIVDVGCACFGVGSGVFACGGGGIVGSEVGAAVGEAHPGTNASINIISMNFWKDFMVFFVVPLLSDTKTPQRFASASALFAGSDFASRP
jgi:hypothetical protein